jgi:acyl-CoA thioesterase
MTPGDPRNLTPTGANEWTIRAAPEREANTGMFGGWTAAVLAKAALSHDEAEGTPVSITANFIARVVPGTDVRLRASLLGGGRSLKTWRSEAFDAAGALLATATLVTANRRESDRFLECAMPSAPAPETIDMAHPPGRFGEAIDIRPVIGFPPFGQKNTRTLSWVRDLPADTLDHLGLVYLADVTPPRIFLISEGPRPSSTVTMSVYFYASDAELAEVGTDYILSEVAGVRAEGSTNGLTMRLWSRTGALLATSEQLCWFR